MKSYAKKAKYTTSLLFSEIAIAILKVTRSLLFNLLVFILGFGIGYIVISLEIHYHAKNHEFNDYILKLHSHLDKIEALDREYAEANGEVRYMLKKMTRDIAHNHHCNSNNFFSCESSFGKKIWK